MKIPTIRLIFSRRTTDSLRTDPFLYRAAFLQLSGKSVFLMLQFVAYLPKLESEKNFVVTLFAQTEKLLESY